MFTPLGVVFVYPCNTAIAWFSSLEEKVLMFESITYEAVYFSADLPSEGVLLFRKDKKYFAVFIGDSYALEDNWNNYQAASSDFIELQFTKGKITHTSSISYLAQSQSFYNFPAEVLKLYAQLLNLRSISDLLCDNSSYPVPEIYRRVVIGEKTYHIFAGGEVEGYIIEHTGNMEAKTFEPGSINEWNDKEAVYCAFVKD